MGTVRTVLVVDDDDAIRLLCRINLELDGHAVVEAGTLREARDVLAAGAVDIVLLDVHIGKDDGLQFLGELRRDRPGVAVAMLTGSTHPDHVRAADPDALIPKPFAIDELRETVRDLGRRASDV